MLVVPEPVCSVLKSTLTPPPPPPPPPDLYPKPQNDEIKSMPPTKISASHTNSKHINVDIRIELPTITSPTSDEMVKLQSLKAPAIELSKYCKLCDISVTSAMHMRLHLAGAKHAKKLRQLGEPPYTELSHTISQCISDESITCSKNVVPIDAIDHSARSSSVDFSVFRTPSGQYYCKVCDLSVTSEVTLSQHFASKRHMKTIKRK